ncbi:glycosyl hydrolase family 65 protein [Hankyongella ginsenosidimutans]|nr:glycosyl hydrolase family 65 protein [Hankyongella ginsenosidimutans]
MAGSWLALVWGLGGFRPSGAGLSLAPRCPAAWSGFRFRLQWRASLIEVEATPQRAATASSPGLP